MTPVIVIAADSDSDTSPLQKAFEAAGVSADLRFVATGPELLDCLYRRGRWEGTRAADLILLDTTIGGSEVLRDIRSRRDLAYIPIIILASSRSQEDVAAAYGDGANTYIPRPESFDDLVNAIKVLCQFWFDVCALPGASIRGRGAGGWDLF
jgi:CheY-like chemotaxis protein